MKELRVVCNRIIPFPGFSAMMLFGIIFRRKEYCKTPIKKTTMNHEGIHYVQALDFVGGIEKLSWLGFICFYIWYLTEWLIKLIMSIFTLCKIKSYKSISFEQEAYKNQYNYEYQETRKRFSWLKYVFKTVEK